MHAATYNSEEAGAIIARLLVENEELRASLVEPAVTAPREWRLTSFEDKLFRMLLKSDVVSKTSMMAVLYGNIDDRPAPKLMDVFVHRIRKKTRPFSVEIRTILGAGYALTDRDVWRKALKIGSGETQH